MPIEFICPNCSKKLRTPDDSAGKRAKCPQCSSIVTVPGESTTAPETPAPDAGFGGAPVGGPTDESFGASDPGAGAFGGGEPNPFSDIGAGQAAVNPYAAPALGKTTGDFGGAASDSANRRGLPWERGGKSLGVFWDTVKLVMSSPTEAFRMMQREGGLGEPMGFAVAGGFVGAMANALYNSVLQGVLFGVMGMEQGGGEVAMAAGMQIVFQIIGGIVGGTIGVIIGLFISSGLYHLFLMMLGATKAPYQTFETTFRVVSYVTGSAALIQLIPICGQYVYGLIALIYMILGLSAAHQISGGKAAAAVLLPLLVCLVSMGVIIGGVIALVASQANNF